MNGRISETLGNLCEVHMVGADHLLGGIDLHCGEIVDDPLSAFVAKELLKLGTANQIVSADLFYCNVGRNMLFQIIDHAVENLTVTAALHRFERLSDRCFLMNGLICIAPCHVNQKMFQI